MAVELMPVVEIRYNNQGFPTPDKYPYWEHAELWDKYNSDRYKKAGFIDELIPYLAGSSFYRLFEITANNLNKLVIDHTLEIRNGKYEREQTSALFGGYVLRIDGQDKYFPQCCGDLSDIHYWDKLSNGKDGFYAGHPKPQVKIDAEKVTLYFSVSKFDEHFIPAPKNVLVLLDIFSLKTAIRIAKKGIRNI